MTAAGATTATVTAAGAATTAVAAAGAAAATTLAAEAVRAVDRAIATGLERNFGLLATARASGRVHLALAAVTAAATVAAPTAITTTTGIARGLAGSAARRTAARGAEALRPVKLLLALGERELRAAIRASEGLICHVSLTNS